MKSNDKNNNENNDKNNDENNVLSKLGSFFVVSWRNLIFSSFIEDE